MKRVITACAAFLMPVAVLAPASAMPAPALPERVTLTWHDCDADLAGWQCGTMRAPRDWGNLDDTRNVRIEMARKPATGAHPIGALTFNPGGPGYSGLAFANDFYDKLPPSIKAKFDFVAWDPRGVGLSRPQLVCNPSTVREGHYDWSDWQALAQAVYEANAAANAACIEQRADIAPYVGTWYVIRDLDAMRSLLGYDTWNFWGQSYGTRIGFRYAREFPTHVRALILDGAMDPATTVDSWAAGLGGGMTYAQSVFTSLFGKKMMLKYSRIMRRLAHSPVTIDGTQWNQVSFGRATLGKMPFQHTYPLIRQTIDAVYQGIFAKPTRTQSTRALNPTGNVFVLAMTNCADMTGRPTELTAARLAQSAALNAGDYAGSATLSAATTCARIPEDFGGHVYAPPEHPLTLPIPPMVVNSLGDWRTPWSGARELATTFMGATMLTYGGTQHVTYLETPSTCINDAVTQYLLTAQPPEPRTCPYVPSDPS